MPNETIVYPISAAPPTWGHADLIQRASRLFSTIYWVVAFNPNKSSLFSIQTKMKMMQPYIEHYKLSNVIIDHCPGSIIQYAKQHNARFILRGLRGNTDLEKEIELATGYRGIDSSIECICFLAKPDLIQISSSLVNELAQINESLQPYVHKDVEAIIQETYRKNNLVR